MTHTHSRFDYWIFGSNGKGGVNSCETCNPVVYTPAMRNASRPCSWWPILIFYGFFLVLGLLDMFLRS